MRIDAPTPTHFETVEHGLRAELDMLEAVARGQVSSASLAWTTNQSLVVPSQMTRQAGFSSAALRSASRGWPVAIRRTGGGTTPQGAGILNIAMAFGMPEGGRISDGFAAICEPMVAAFKAFGLNASIGSRPGSFCDGDFNILVDERKIAGTAQRWRRCKANGQQAILAHALVLVDCDTATIVNAVSNLENDLRTGFSPKANAHIALRDCVGGAACDAVVAYTLDRLRAVSKPYGIPDAPQKSGASGELSRIEDGARRERMELTES